MRGHGIMSQVRSALKRVRRGIALPESNTKLEIFRMWTVSSRINLIGPLFSTMLSTVCLGDTQTFSVHTYEGMFQ